LIGIKEGDWSARGRGAADKGEEGDERGVGKREAEESSIGYRTGS